MKALLWLIAAACLGMPARAQHAPSPQEPLMRCRTSFDLVVRAPYAQAAPLFGPEGERAWAGKNWDPEFIYPLPAHDEQGVVFTVRHGPFSAVWVNTVFDVEAQHIQYAYFLPEIMVTVIDVRFQPEAAATWVHVVYTRTALTAAGNQHVAAMSEADKSAGREWEQSIAAYLASRKAGTRH